jgi:hypothetical protein
MMWDGGSPRNKRYLNTAGIGGNGADASEGIYGERDVEQKFAVAAALVLRVAPKSLLHRKARGMPQSAGDL